MKSGLYACAGASATASAAACAKRLRRADDEESNVYFGFMRSSPASAPAWRSAGGSRDGPGAARAPASTVSRTRAPGRRVAHRGLDQAEEMALDPLAREVVRDATIVKASSSSSTPRASREPGL